MDAEDKGPHKTCFTHKHSREPWRDRGCFDTLLISKASSGDDTSLKHLHLQESETIPIPIKGRPAHCLCNEGIIAVSGRGVERGDPSGPVKDFKEKKSVRANLRHYEGVKEGLGGKASAGWLMFSSYQG